MSTRLDNLSVAREMEAEKKDAKAVKMATGWERGADGKEQTYEDGMFEQMVESGVLKRAQKTEEPSEAKVDLTDNQGNPVNDDGTLKVEAVQSVDELTDEDFSAPTRNVQLPALPQNVDAAIGANGKPVIIKKNIFEKNWNTHRFPFEESRAILNAALYNTDLVGQTQPNNKPLHWVAIKIDDKSPIVVLEVNENKDNIEIVGWYTLDERNLNRIKRQAEKNGGELVMLSPKDKVESLSTPQTDLSSESKGTEQSSSVQVDVSENAPMPMRVVGKGKNAVQEENWLATTPKRGHDYVFKESGLDAEEANAFVENKVAEAEKNLEKVKGKAPKMGTNIAAYKEAKADYEARVAEAQKAVDYWHAVKAERDKVLLEERRARKEKDKALYDDAVAQEEQRKAEMAQKAAEQEALGSNAVAPAIKEKWENAPKVDGGADEITLPNGEVVTGHYVLTESGAASASHQATNGFAETEGYPVDVNGETVNDRDYKRDAEAQQVTRGMAADYDSRALQSPVVVSGDGVVLSGNGRTMAGEIAALNGSDAKYNAYLRGHAGKFGFTTEQVEGFKHPRVVFVPDGEMPYTSETFAKFNQREQKSQSRTEMAVKLGKVVDDALFGRVMDVIGRHESLAEFYADDAATASVVKELADAGVIPQTEMAQLFDGGRLSESGQAMVEGVLVGKVFQGSPDAVRQITEVKSMRKVVMAALPEVVACHRLGGGYDLSKELAAAVDLVYKARKAGFKLGQHVSQHARQGNLFQLDDGATVADYNNAAVMMLADVMNDGRVTQLKKVLSFYNTQAADSAQGIGDMFAGGVKSKGQIINEVNELLNNGQEYDRRTPSVADGQGVGGEGGEQGDVAGPSHQGGEGSERGLSEAFDGLAAQLKTAEGEERKRVLGEMRDGIARFAEENGYPVPEFLLTRDDFLAAVPEKDRAKYVEMLEKGMRMPAYYENKKVYYFVEGCDNFDKDVAETLAHEYTHADNAEFPENVNAIVYAVEDTHEVSQDELVDILEKLSDSTVYEEKAEQLEAEGKNANPMLADEVIAHSVGRMVVEGEQALDGITKNPTLQFFIKRAYKERENERQHNLYSNRNAERADKTVPSSGRNSSDNEAVAGGIPGDGQLGGSSEGDGHLEGTAERGRSVVSGGKEVAAPSLEGAKVGVTDGEKSSATGDVVPSGEGDTPLSEKIATASAEVNTEPTEAQKEAGNYKKGHVQVGTFDITIEQPQGSVRKGTDADGKQWESKMNNTYGYIRGAVGVDGDHIDVFLSNDIDGWNGRKVFVVDQYNPDGSFDEHKVMLGFNDADEAKSDYLANYENGWENGRRIDVTAVNLEDFEKWIASSKRKTKPFGEYSSVKNGVVPSGEGKTDNLRQQKAVGKSAQPPTREESILRDVVIEHMKGSGLDVIGTEDGQRVLDMVNEDGAKEHRVYHGSGAEFDHFDHSHMGEGEGAQAYGWGTYVTEVRGIGEGYAIRSKNGISMSREEWSLKRSELESNIYRAKEQLPFLKGEYKAEVEAQISEWEEQLKDYEPHNYLYTVEIPDDNGGNYLDWNGPVPAETIDRITEYLREKYGDEVVNGRWLSNPLLSSKGVDVSARNGAAIYRQLERALGSDKKASQLLSSLGYAGIKYPAEFRSGGRKDDAKNYVIFNENDAEITDHVRFFKTKNGEAYGFTVGGKIYYDPRIANAETPVHEYAHLWASALKANNAKEWKNVVDLMKGTNVWEEVKKTYPELDTDDEIADEVLATYSGRRGAERLREEMRKAAAEGDGVMGKAEAVSALQRVKRAIDKFWKAVADFLHIHYTSAEEVADRVMKDLLDGVDPRSMMDGGKSLRPETRINIVETKSEHGFKNYAEAKTWAKEHIARTYSGEETGGKGDIRISNAAVDKYLSQSAVDKSESKDVHLAVLKVLPDVIRESVDAEQHADFKKGEDGARSAANGVNPNVTIHRLYGAVRMDGKLYRVKVTLKENTRTKETPKAYSYEATKIELLEGSLSQTEGSHNLEPSNSKSEVSAGQHGNVSGLTSTFPRYSDKSITAANLLNGVEKSYDGGKFFEDYNKIREQFIGEKGASAADHADEVNTRLDNLSVAREMEAEKKDAKAIKMATGWERGADGKWRYEVGDVRFYDGLQLINRSVKTEATLNDLLEDNKDKEALFASYPSLKNMPVVLEDMGYKGAGEYNYGKGTIRLNTYLLTDDDGYFTKPAVEILNHEIQHAIQKIEGLARGGSPAMVRSEIKKQMAEVTKQIRQLRAEGKEAEAKELIKKNRGLYEASVGDDDFGSYKSLAGEVESRNVERRMGMSAEERRASLAAETEDVSREDQIFLTSGDGGNANSEMLQETGTENDYSEFAKEHGVDADMVKDYALGIKTGNLHKADFALAEIRRTMRVANRGMKLSEFGKLFRPVQKELAERYGDIEVLRQEHIDAEMRERGVMEAARKRAEEEAAKRKARADELRLLPEEELDRRYFEAVERGDDAAAREMLDEAARRKGYGDTESEYQGVGAWVAPSNPGYESDAARRADVEDNAPDVNVEDIALGYSLVDENYWHEPRKYMQTDATAVESVNAINDAMAAIRRGEKDVKVKVYRAVPTSVKEGKLRNGDWVTPSRAYAKMHGEHRLEGDYRIIEDEVPVNELWWDGNDSREWGFDDGKGYKYKNVENSRKLNDLVTRDDNGEIIAPSKRFDENVEDVRYRTSEELGQEYGSRWIDEQTNEDGRHTTQVKNTLNSYKKFGDWVMRDSGGKKVDVLDASSGLGLGTEWLRKNGIDAEDVEPYPSENRTAPTYRNYDEVGKKYDYIISNAVLNVIPNDWRASVLHNMADKLKVGGKLVINVRSAESIRKQGKEGETRITLDDPSEILVLRPNGSIKAYQKGFTKAELKEWCEKELGNGYSVEIANDKNAGGSYDTAVVVTKNNESGTIGVASEAGRPRRSAQALPSSNAKLDNNQKFANNLLVLSENLSERDMGAHEFLFNVAKAFGLNGQNLNKSFYQDLSNSVGIRISDHSANTDNITNRNVNDDVYGLVVKLSKNRFKSRSDANYLEYVYYPDKLTGERQREIVEGLNKFLQTGDYMQLPAPDRVNRSGKFDVLIDGRETSPTAKHQAANDLARQMHVEGEVEVVTSTDGLTGRQAKAKGWYDVRTGRVTIVLPNNKNAADVRETVFHEVVAHKGLRNLVGEEHFNTFLDNVYNNAEEGIKQTIDEMAEKKYNGDKRKATEEYMAHLAEDGEFVKPENQGFFAKVRDFLTDLLRKVGIKLGFKLTDNDLRYILWRSWKGLAERDGGSVFEKAEDVKMQHELGQTDEARSASGENGIMFREGSDELKDVVEKMKADVERLHEGELDDLRSGARAIGGRLSELNKAMRLQRAYDMSTVASVTELAKTMLKNGLLSEMLPSNATSNGGDASRVHRDFKAKVHRLTCN
ncbi:LPD23 domain-containing protein [Prevotellamassilia timonensis]|uniref:LPD23 domain-containing protein n=2 Tax=Prevotellamassilia timonensis TaxID=1852370 RepID=UPI00307EE50D